MLPESVFCTQSRTRASSSKMTQLKNHHYHHQLSNRLNATVNAAIDTQPSLQGALATASGKLGSARSAKNATENLARSLWLGNRTVAYNPTNMTQLTALAEYTFGRLQFESLLKQGERENESIWREFIFRRFLPISLRFVVAPSARTVEMRRRRSTTRFASSYFPSRARSLVFLLFLFQHVEIATAFVLFVLSTSKNPLPRFLLLSILPSFLSLLYQVTPSPPRRPCLPAETG